MSKPLIISIIDDDDIYRYTILKTIQALNISRQTLIFIDGEQALQFMTDNVANVDELPDVILLDVNMPVMDGFGFMEEYVKLIPRIAKKIIVFMISSSVNPKDIDLAKSIPEITDYIVKPIEPGKLVRILADLENKGLL